MEMSPQEIVGTTFRVVKKGFDPEEVRSFQIEAARALEDAQNQASLMEQRARAAVAKAQGLAASAGTPPPGAGDAAAAAAVVALRADDAETISRTLVLAQRTAEHTIAEATRDAADIRASADAEAHDLLGTARASSARLVTDARNEARRTGEAQRASLTNEVQALLARLDFLRGDVQEMEAYALAHRRRLAEAAEALRVVSEQRILGAADLRPPVLSPAADMERTPATGTPMPAVADVASELPAPVIEPAPVPAAAPRLELVEVVATPEEDDLVASTAADDTAPDGLEPLPSSEFTWSDQPTGEIPAIRPTSGPVAVPDLDEDWDVFPSDSAASTPRPNDLRIVGEP